MCGHPADKGTYLQGHNSLKEGALKVAEVDGRGSARNDMSLSHLRTGVKVDPSQFGTLVKAGKAAHAKH